MTRRRSCSWPPGIVAQGRAIAISAALFLPAGLAGSDLVPLFPPLPPENASPIDTGAVQRALLVLEGLRENQTRLSDAIARLEAAQTAALERQAQTIRQHQTALADRLSAERERHRRSLEDLGQLAVIVVLSVAGVLLFAMGAVAWSLLRALQRLPTRPLLARPAVAGQDEVGLPIFPDPQLLGAISELEKRLLRLGESVNSADSPATRKAPKLSEGTTLVPGDFL